MGTERYASSARFVAISFLTFILAACGGGGGGSSSTPSTGNFTVAGSIGDGPIVYAEINVQDANGTTIASSASDSQANFRIEIPANTALPVTITGRGGVDLVTQRPADFDMVALILETGSQTVNVSPLTTMVVKAAQCAGDISETKLDQLWQAVNRDLNIGLDTAVLANPMTDGISAANIETAVLANEALGEWIRRAGASLTTSNIRLEQVVQAMACDLGDGAMDGVMANPVQSVSAEQAQRVLAVSKAVEAGVRLEVLAGRLEVDGVDATQAMNDAISAVLPAVTNPDVNSVPVTDASLEKAIEALSIMTGVLNDPELTALVTALEGATPGNADSVVDVALDTNAHITLQGLPTRIGLADTTEITEINDRAEQQSDMNRPIVALGADPDSIGSGATSVLSWASSNADRCTSEWGGEMDTQGVWTTPALTTSTRYAMSCFGLGGATEAYIDVIVDSQPIPGTQQPQPDPVQPQPDPQLPEPDPQEPQPDPQEPQPDPQQPEPQPGVLPTVSLSVNNTSVPVGGSAELTWSSTNADSCSASGGWSGAKATSGSMSVGPITTSSTFTLNCTNAAGTASNMVNVLAMGQIQLNWIAPTKDIDGSDIEGLAAYKLHYGPNSGQYDEIVEIAGNLTSYTLNLPVGTYFLAMTTIDQESVESDLSAEVELSAQ